MNEKRPIWLVQILILICSGHWNLKETADSDHVQAAQSIMQLYSHAHSQTPIEIAAKWFGIASNQVVA